MANNDNDAYVSLIADELIILLEWPQSSEFVVFLFSTVTAVEAMMPAPVQVIVAVPAASAETIP